MAKSCVDSWYEEIKKYDFKNPDFSEETGHFTQLVWAESKKIGVGLGHAENGNKNSYICVVHYFPAGNVIGDFSKNVIKPNFKNNY